MKEHYVYELRDPFDNTVFYVGKGKGRRAEQHEKEAKEEGKPLTPKIKKIREILSKKAHPMVVVVARFSSKKEALAAEALLIHWIYGHPSDCEISTLTNIQGGHGGETVRVMGNFNVTEGLDIPKAEKSSNIRMNYPNGSIAFLDHRRVWVGYAEGRIVCTRDSSSKVLNFLKTRYDIDGQVVGK